VQGTPGLRRRGAPGRPYPPLDCVAGRAVGSDRVTVSPCLTDGAPLYLPSQGRGVAYAYWHRRDWGTDGVQGAVASRL